MQWGQSHERDTQREALAGSAIAHSAERRIRRRANWSGRSPLAGPALPLRREYAHASAIAWRRRQ